LPDFPGIRTAAVGFVIGDKVYVGSGTDFYLTYKSFCCYSFETNTWSSISDPPADFSQRIWGTAFTLGNTGYVLAGRSEPYDPNFNNGKMLNDLWAYAPCLPPVAKFSYIVNGLTVNFQDSSTTLQNWNWNFGDGCTSTLQNPVHSYSNPGKYQVCLTVEDSCGNGSFCDSVEVLCNKPTALWGYSNVGTIVHFFDSTTSASSWIWDFGDGYASYLQNPVHQYTEEGNYYVCLTAEDSCGSDIHCDTAQICDPLFTKFTNQNQGHFVIFSDSSEKAISWFWDFGDGFMSVLQNPVHYYQEFDTYYVCLTVTNICETKKWCDSILVMTNGIGEIPVDPLSAFPNPVRDFLNIRWSGIKDKNTLFTIFDYYGEVLNGDYLYGLYEDRIDVKCLQPGLYFLRIISGNNISTVKFVKTESY
jgi:PKD repeat protein